MTSLEELNKTQVVLLTVLIAFVTSIATGIITASLLSQAPASVTQTIDRVIENTIQPANPSATSTVVREVTVIKEEDEITSAIQNVLPSVVRISGPVPAGGDGFFGLGAIVSKDGLVIGSAAGLSLGASYNATLSDGSNMPLKIAGMDQADGLVLWKLTSDTAHISFDPLVVSKSDAKLGQSVIAVEGKSGSTVAVGRVSLNGGQPMLAANVRIMSRNFSSFFDVLTALLMGISADRSWRLAPRFWRKALYLADMEWQI